MFLVRYNVFHIKPYIFSVQSFTQFAVFCFRYVFKVYFADDAIRVCKNEVGQCSTMWGDNDGRITTKLYLMKGCHVFKISAFDIVFDKTFFQQFFGFVVVNGAIVFTVYEFDSTVRVRKRRNSVIN